MVGAEFFRTCLVPITPKTLNNDFLDVHPNGFPESSATWSWRLHEVPHDFMCTGDAVFGRAGSRVRLRIASRQTSSRCFILPIFVIQLFGDKVWEDEEEMYEFVVRWLCTCQRKPCSNSGRLSLCMTPARISYTVVPCLLHYMQPHPS